MAIYHLNVAVKSRGRGQSAIAAAAYQSGKPLVDRATGETKDYSRRSERVVASAIILPEGAPPEWRSREELWNAVESQTKRADAQLARRIVVALPVELDEDQRLGLAERLARHLASQGMCVDIAVHTDAGGRNPHAHILATTRPVRDGRLVPASENRYLVRDWAGNDLWVAPGNVPDGYEKVYRYAGGLRLTRSQAAEMGLGNADRTSRSPVTRKWHAQGWDSREWLDALRADWARMTNAALEAAGLSERVDHRSNEARGLDAVPTRHEGWARGRRRDEARAFNDWARARNARAARSRADAPAPARRATLSRRHRHLRDERRKRAVVLRSYGRGADAGARVSRSVARTLGEGLTVTARGMRHLSGWMRLDWSPEAAACRFADERAVRSAWAAARGRVPATAEEEARAFEAARPAALEARQAILELSDAMAEVLDAELFGRSHASSDRKIEAMLRAIPAIARVREALASPELALVAGMLSPEATAYDVINAACEAKARTDTLKAARRAAESPQTALGALEAARRAAEGRREDQGRPRGPHR